ncbi:GGDEF domain-containing protein [Krasilnikovia sp. MM14-A1004]|uniref:GGDEF domain-containing protein n=1 Tax=Krasilnikovia sp. MM14-A1004 TaxID=3373541 RepID=UPI00399C6FED
MDRARAAAPVETSPERQLRQQAELRRAVLSDRVCWAAAVLGMLWLGLYAAATALSQGDEGLTRFVGSILYLVPVAAAAVACGVTARGTRGRTRTMWRFLCASSACWLAGDVCWAVYAYTTPDGGPDPSIADVAYLASNALTVPAIVIGFGGAHLLRHARGLLDATLVAVGLGAVGWPLLIAPQLSGGADLAALVSSAYPLLDLAILAIMVAVGLAGHRMVPYPVLLIAAAYLTATISDGWYTYVTVVHEYSDGSWLNLGYQAEAVLILLAALVAVRHQGEAQVTRIDRDVTFPAVLVAAFAVATLIGVEQAHHQRIGSGTLAVAAVLFMGLLVRQMLSTRDRTRLARELHAALREQERLAVTDPLTGLYNRRFFQEMLADESERCTRSGQPIAMVILDLDHFKGINDRYGHPAGDAVLVQVADRLRQTVRAGDVVARFGGEEFVCLLHDADETAALDLAERLRETLRRTPIDIPAGPAISVTASVGVAGTPSRTTVDPARLIAEADRALYRAKRDGRDRVMSAHRHAAAPIDGETAWPVTSSTAS